MLQKAAFHNIEFLFWKAVYLSGRQTTLGDMDTYYSWFENLMKKWYKRLVPSDCIFSRALSQFYF